MAVWHAFRLHQSSMTLARRKGRGMRVWEALMFWGGRAAVHLVVVGTRVGEVVPIRKV